MAALPFLANDQGPAWLPGAAREARQFAYWGQLIMFLFLIIAALAAVLSFVFGQWVSGIYFIVSAAVDIVLLFMLNQTVFDPLDQGRFKEVSDRLLIWGIIGLLFIMVLPGLFLLLAYVKLQEVFQPQYQQYPTQYYQAPQQYPGQAPPPQYQAPPQPQYQPQAPPQQYQAPPPQAAPPPYQAPPPQQQPKQDMVKCKNCGVQYPSFMRNCPSCGAPRN